MAQSLLTKAELRSRPLAQGLWGWFIPNSCCSGRISSYFSSVAIGIFFLTKVLFIVLVLGPELRASLRLDLPSAMELRPRPVSLKNRN